MFSFMIYQIVECLDFYEPASCFIFKNILIGDLVVYKTLCTLKTLSELN